MQRTDSLEILAFLCCSSSLISASWRMTRPHPATSSSLLSTVTVGIAGLLRGSPDIFRICWSDPFKLGLIMEVVPDFADKESVNFDDGLKAVFDTSLSLEGSVCNTTLEMYRDDVLSSSSGAKSSWKPATSGLPCKSSSSLKHHINDSSGSRTVWLFKSNAAFTPGHMSPGNMYPGRATCIRIHICWWIHVVG